MPGLARITGFAVVLAVVFAASLALGDAVDPNPSRGEPAEEHGDAMAMTGPRGLATASDGLTLELARTRVEPGRRTDLAFRIVDEGGVTATDFDIGHERRMHLIVVRRDMSGYQHLHPQQADDGTWHVPLTVAEPGTYRVFADFARNGDPVTLGADIHAAGDYAPLPLPAPSDVAHNDAYEVLLEADGGELEFQVMRDGRPVTDIEPYLGARGHLVALRDGDLAYLHVHPDEDELAFGVEYPSAGRYRLFLQFKHEGRVHTAEFTQEVSDAGGH